MSTKGTAEALFPASRREILALLFGHPDQSFYLREIVERTGLGMGAVQRELQRLTESGLLLRAERGRHVYFQADSTNPVFGELRSLMMKTVGATDIVREALQPLADRIHVAFVFGSVARGEQAPDSDLDLLIVGDLSLREVVGVLAEAQARLGREISPTVYPLEELREKSRAGDHFLDSVLGGEKVFLIGSDDELGELLAQ